MDRIQSINIVYCNLNAKIKSTQHVMVYCCILYAIVIHPVRDMEDIITTRRLIHINYL